MITRILTQSILDQLTNNNLPRGVILYGPRQVGKTTLTKQLVDTIAEKTLVISGDRRDQAISILETRDWDKIKLVLAGYSIIVIDEAQRISEIGLIAKIILDSDTNVKVILTGSSSLDLASKISEPLTGRAYSYHLWPISQQELSQTLTYAERLSILEERVILGSYPKIVTLDNLEEKKDYLLNLINQYLYKDILDFGGIKNSGKIRDLLKLVAYQTGFQASIAELATQLEISRDTVNHYLDLLESSFIIFRLGGFNRNLRNEVHKMKKIYFWDTGIRNALLNQLDWRSSRHDWGQIWENYQIAERLKRNEYEKWHASYYYWRLSTGAELDLVEQKGNLLTGFEIKSSSKLPRIPISWQKSYPDSNYQVVNSDSWDNFATTTHGRK